MHAFSLWATIITIPVWGMMPLRRSCTSPTYGTWLLPGSRMPNVELEMDLAALYLTFGYSHTDLDVVDLVRLPGDVPTLPCHVAPHPPVSCWSWWPT